MRRERLGSNPKRTLRDTLTYHLFVKPITVVWRARTRTGTLPNQIKKLCAEWERWRCCLESTNHKKRSAFPRLPLLLMPIPLRNSTMLRQRLENCCWWKEIVPLTKGLSPELCEARFTCCESCETNSSSWKNSSLSFRIFSRTSSVLNKNFWY